MTVSKEIFKILIIFIQFEQVLRITHFSSSSTMLCIICHLFTETSLLKVFCYMVLGRKLLLEIKTGVMKHNCI